MTTSHEPTAPSPGAVIRRLVAENEDAIERLFDRHGLSREERGEMLFDVLVHFGVRHEGIGNPRQWLLAELEHRCERRRLPRGVGDGEGPAEDGDDPSGEEGA